MVALGWRNCDVVTQVAEVICVSHVWHVESPSGSALDNDASWAVDGPLGDWVVPHVDGIFEHTEVIDGSANVQFAPRSLRSSLFRVNRVYLLRGEFFYVRFRAFFN